MVNAPYAECTDYSDFAKIFLLLRSEKTRTEKPINSDNTGLFLWQWMEVENKRDKPIAVIPEQPQTQIEERPHNREFFI
jgi:hypothetical protein